VIESNSSLHALLQKLHEENDRQVYARARKQYRGDDESFQKLALEYASLGPRTKGAFLRSHGLTTNDSNAVAAAEANLSLAISPQMGAFLTNIVLAKRPNSVLELGSSNGVSTLYFANALASLNTGTVVATESNPMKCANLRKHARAAGLDGFVDLREGDIFETLDALNGAFDIIFLDMWASDYLEAAKKLERLIVPGTVILADNMYTAEDEVRPFKDYLSGHARIATTTLDFESGVEFAVVR
jgi:predicted O-methyltransferase YrrM